MIKYALTCSTGHRFDAWFRNADSYDDQVEAGIVTCPPRARKACAPFSPSGGQVEKSTQASRWLVVA